MEQRSNKAGYGFRNLLIWQSGQELALDVIRLTERLPDTSAARVLARQIVAAAASVPANIAEGHGRYSIAAFRNHLSIARGSICETETFIDLFRRAGYVNDELGRVMTTKCSSIRAGITSHMRLLEKRLKANRENKIAEQPQEYSADDQPGLGD